MSKVNKFHHLTLVSSVAIVIFTTSALAADLKTFQTLPTQAVTLPAASQAVSPVAAPAALPQANSPAALPANGVQLQKAPIALPQANSPATLPASGGVQVVKPVGNFGAAKVIQFNKNTNIDLQNESDSTVLAGPNGEKITAGQLKKQLSNPLTNETLQKLNASNVQTNDSQYSFKNKAFILPIKTTEVGSESATPPATTKLRDHADIGMLNVNYCPNETKTPKILKVRGTVTPGSKLGIYGECFGDTKSEVRITGPNIKGIIRLQPDVWTGRYITASVPTVAGTTEGQAELEVITLESRRSIEYPINFIPTYEYHSSIKKFAGCRDYSDENNKRKCGAGYIQHTSWEHTNFAEHAKYDRKPPVKEFDETWGIDINPACKLDEIKLTGYGPEVSKFIGYIDPNNQSHGGASFKETFRTTYEEHWYGDNNWYNGYAAVNASAYCPAGISP